MTKTKSKIELHLIPGTMCNEKLWSKILPYLENDFELVYLDIPLDKNLDEITEIFKDKIQSKAINLIGFSLGGYLATYFAMKYPECISRLFVISNSPCELPSEEIKQRNQMLSYIKQHGYTGISRKKAASMLDTKHQSDELVNLILEMDNDLGEQTLISQYQLTSSRMDLAQHIKCFEFPSYFYFSENDPLVNKIWINNTSQYDTKIKVLETSGSGHMLPIEKPLELAGYIQLWASEQ
ncbi:alpha/beta hydrolase [Parashewanella curva]|uniref:Alpha/beta hydrolase n=1 Tax=Parashewanella curva TaxID=2338552 RepID=A0A3L8PRU8_9GAMM|nr:alpha/beta hydrolase [Parashewanella curva]RLV58115.1 alpha/beta hydrolase [Parashewanella curva]